MTLNSTTQLTPEVSVFYDSPSSTYSYIVKDPQSQVCAIIDSVLDFDYASGSIGYDSANTIIEAVTERKLVVEMLIETHVHADHISAAPYLQEQLGGKIAISKRIIEVQHEFGKVFNEGTCFARDGSQFDVLFEDNQAYQIGQLQCTAMATPGHTPACMTHIIGDAAFVGDTLFNPDEGTARTDFPGGNARTLYRSIQKILSLPASTRLFLCHDYQANGRELCAQTTVEEQKRLNIHANTKIGEDQFVSLRETRDHSLHMPKLLMPSLQVNMRAGNFPPTEDNETVYLKVPLNGIKQS